MAALEGVAISCERGSPAASRVLEWNAGGEDAPVADVHRMSGDTSPVGIAGVTCHSHVHS
jgi:hypothetical protein